MRSRSEIQDALMAVGLPIWILAVFAGGPFLLLTRPPSPLALSASPYLRQLVGPVRLEFAIALDDGGSKDVAFRDATGRRVGDEVIDRCRKLARHEIDARAFEGDRGIASTSKWSRSPCSGNRPPGDRSETPRASPLSS